MHGATIKIIIYTIIYFKSSPYNIFTRKMNKINIIDQGWKWERKKKIIHLRASFHVQIFIYSDDNQVEKRKTDGRGYLKKRDSLDYFGVKCEDIVKTDLKSHDRTLTGFIWRAAVYSATNIQVL